MPICNTDLIERTASNARRPYLQINLYQRLADRIRHLRHEDQVIVELALSSRLPVRQIGRVLDADPGTVSRRIRRLIRRLCDPVVAALCDPNCSLEPARRQIALERLLGGKSLAAIARSRQLSVAEVRNQLHFALGFARGRTSR